MTPKEEAIEYLKSNLWMSYLHDKVSEAIDIAIKAERKRIRNRNN